MSRSTTSIASWIRVCIGTPSFWMWVAAVRGFHRVLKPGGMLLLTESCRRYILSWLIRILFRHPM